MKTIKITKGGYPEAKMKTTEIAKDGYQWLLLDFPDDATYLCVDLDVFALAWANRNTNGFVFARCFDSDPSSMDIDSDPSSMDRPRLTVLKTGNGKILHKGKDITAMIGAYVDPVTWGCHFVDRQMISQDYLREAEDHLHGQIILKQDVPSGCGGDCSL